MGENFDQRLNAAVVNMLRKAAKDFGFNCTFADEDLAIICSLANRAIKENLTDHLSENIRSRLRINPEFESIYQDGK